MNETPKQNEELAKSVTGFLDKYGAKLFKGVSVLYKKASDETRINWRLGYERYLDKALNKYFYAKTFLSYNEPLPLYDLYVPLSVSVGETVVEKTSITDLMSANKFSIIMATGGSGKTMMMRHLFVDTIEKTAQVPVFVELRELNDSELDLFGLIKKKLRDNKFDFGDDYIEKAFEAGHFVLLLDGFDEVADAKRSAMVSQLDEIADKYEKNYIILSSRPDESLHRWTLFNVWRVQSLTLELACELIEKTEADEEIKEKFVKALKGELFEKHESFLSNPLLLAIMLITYKDTANIPEKISTFYERAFTALFDQHDARKAFHRKKRSNLDILDFKKVFSAFCFFTYKDDLYNFSEAKALEYLEKAQKYTGIKFEKKDFLHDSIQAVCLLLRDGLEIIFSHRSFQEYFTAVFLSQISNAKVHSSYIRSILNSFLEGEDTLDLLFEISPEVIEKELLIPGIEELESIIGYKNHLTIKTYKKLINVFYSGYALLRDGWLANYGDGLKLIKSAKLDVDNIVHFIRRHYAVTKTIVDFKEENLSEDSPFFQLVSKYKSEHPKVEIDFVLQNKELTKILADGNHWLSKNSFQKFFDLKNDLIEKHRNQEMLLEEEIFNNKFSDE